MLYKKAGETPAFLRRDARDYLLFDTMYSMAALRSASEQLAQVPRAGITPVLP